MSATGRKNNNSNSNNQKNTEKNRDLASINNTAAVYKDKIDDSTGNGFKITLMA
jgi:hypothetical protein